MGLFGKSFDEKVQDAITDVRKKVHGLSALSAQVEDKVVTLTGEAQTPEAKAQAMHAFNELVETKNTINQIRVHKPAPVSPAASPAATAPMAAAPVTGMTTAPTSPLAAGPAERIHEVVKGDTLSALAKKYYGNASQYMKIFEANRDQLKDPDKIQIGQKLRIPPAPSAPVA